MRKVQFIQERSGVVFTAACTRPQHHPSAGHRTGSGSEANIKRCTRRTKAWLARTDHAGSVSDLGRMGVHVLGMAEADRLRPVVRGTLSLGAEWDLVDG